MKRILLLSAIFIAMSNFSVVLAKKKTIHVLPQSAKIFLNNSEIGTGTYTVDLKRKDEFVIFRFEAPGYIDRTVKLFRNNPSKVISYELSEDEAFANSVGSDEGADLANKVFSVTCKKGLKPETVWKRLMNIAINNFENVEVRDESAGWIRTVWVLKSFEHQIVRTRLEIRMQFVGEDELSYRVTLDSEIADRECGTSNQCFEPYDRILKRYEDVINELQTTVGSNF